VPPLSHALALLLSPSISVALALPSLSGPLKPVGEGEGEGVGMESRKVWD